MTFLKSGRKCNAFPPQRQESIPVECVAPALYRTRGVSVQGVSLSRSTPWTETPWKEHGTKDRDPQKEHGTRDRDPWKEHGTRQPDRK